MTARARVLLVLALLSCLCACTQTSDAPRDLGSDTALALQQRYDSRATQPTSKAHRAALRAQAQADLVAGAHTSRRWICSPSVFKSNGLARIGALRVIGLSQSTISWG